MANFEYFEHDADFLKVHALPCFCPTLMIDGREEKIKVSKPRKSKGKGSIDNLYLDVGGCPNFTLELAIRELIQNLIDGAVDMNGDSHQGLKISRGTLTANSTDGIEIPYNTTIIHNGVVKFAEFQQSASRLYFINFGNLLPSKAALLAFGRSSKNNKVSQAGKHGEGMKIAFMRFLQKDARIEVFACIPHEDGIVNEYNRFKIQLIKQGRDAGTVTFKHTKRVPDDKPGAPLHFMLSISTKAIKGRIDIFDSILVPRQDLLTVITSKDPGNLILDDKFRGKLYVKHVFLTNYQAPEMRYSYDVFHLEVNRSREDPNWQKLALRVAEIWDKNMLQHGKLFFDHFVSNTSNAFSSLVEVQAIRYLSLASREILNRLLRGDNARVRLITQADQPRFKRCFGGNALVVNHNAERLILKSLNEEIQEYQPRLFNAECVEVEMAAALTSCFKPLKIQLCDVGDCDLRLVHNPAITELKINLATFNERKVKTIAWYISTYVIYSIQSYTPYGFLETLFPDPAPVTTVEKVQGKEATLVEKPPKADSVNDKKRPPFEVPAEYDCSLEWVIKKRKSDPQ